MRRTIVWPAKLEKTPVYLYVKRTEPKAAARPASTSEPKWAELLKPAPMLAEPSGLVPLTELLPPDPDPEEELELDEEELVLCMPVLDEDEDEDDWDCDIV